MKLFISCDWGTTSFRLRLINAETIKVVGEVKSVQGIANTYGLWKSQQVINRQEFYTGFIMKQVQLLQQQSGYSLGGLVIVISGMASSSIGMIELPYKQVPFYVDGAAFEILRIPATANNNPMMIVSGVRSAKDVMRGEETILAGCDIDDGSEEQLFVFPGTHSKHVAVKNGMLHNITTYMTGELFDLLSAKSVLASSVEANSCEGRNNEFYKKGVHDALNDNFLNTIFHTRTNELFGLLSKSENYHYLSGLLIGEELRHVSDDTWAAVTIVSEGVLLALYLEALFILGFKNKVNQKNSDEALIKGQQLIFSHG